MATGDSNDILSRVKAVLPRRWFSFIAPIRDAVLGGLSESAAWCYSLITYAQAQARISTAFGPFLDLIAFDFTGRYLQRNGASDHVFAAKIKATILQERVTRAGMINALTTLTGTAPTVFEPWNTGDAGAYSSRTTACGRFAYGRAGGWGNMNLPSQVFLTVTRSSPSGVPDVGGYGNNAGGYDAGAIEYVGPQVEQVGVTDDDIYETIVTTKPVGTICWTSIN